MDLCIFQGPKFTGGVYTRGLAGYGIFATDAPSRYRGRVAVFHWPLLRYAVEAIHQFWSNVISFQLVTGEQQWHIIVCYLAPDNTLTIESVIAALKDFPRGSELLVTGDLNINLEDPEGDRREEGITAALTTAGLEDMPSHFLLGRCPWCRDRIIWIMVLLGRKLTDHILGTYLCIFRNVAFQDPRHNSDHYFVLVGLCNPPLRKHTGYPGRSIRLPFWPPTTSTREDGLFAAL